MKRIIQYMRSSRRFAFSACIVMALGFVSIFAPFIANDVPIVIVNEHGVEWPILSARFDGDSIKDSYRNLDESSWALFPLIPYNMDTNLKQRFLPPGSIDSVGNLTTRHWLGTDRLGKDVAAGLIYGCRNSVFIALLAMVISVLLGVCIGGLAGYFGNHLCRVSIGSLVLTVSLGLYFVFLGAHHRLEAVPIVIAMVLYMILLFMVHRRDQKAWKVDFPLDGLVLRIIEIIQSLPGLLILLVIASLIARPTFFGLAVIIGLLRWPGVAKYVRAEVQKTREEDYILAARISGLHHLKILTKYVLPRTVAPIVVIFSFGFAAVVLLESTLSFLGIGVPIGDLTLGNLLGQAKDRPQAWWLAVFPGGMIFLIVASLNALGDQFRSLWESKD